MNEEQIRLIEEWIKKCTEGAVTSIDEEGYPRTVIMSNIKVEGIREVWFATGLDANKISHFRRNNKGCVCYHVAHHNITLIGDIEIVEDMETKKALWLDWFIEHFPLGMEDPNYCIFRLRANRVSVWIDELFGDFSLE